MAATIGDGDFFRPQMSIGMKIQEGLRTFVFSLVSRTMLIYYVVAISLILVVGAPIIVTNYFATESEDLTLREGSCRLKEGFMIDCIPDIHDSLISEDLCNARGCCFKLINKDKDAPVCHRRIPSARNMIASSNFLLPSEINEADSDNPPFVSSMVYRVASLTPGHVVVRLCSELGTGQCLNEEDSSTQNDSGLNVKMYSENSNRLEITVSRLGLWNTTIFDSSKGATIIGKRMTEISTLLSSPYIYGLGGHPASFHSTKASNFTYKSLFSSNFMDFPQRTSIKSFLGIDERKSFYGIVMESQTPLEVELLPGVKQEKPLLVLRSMGGEVSFHFFSGPKPSDVMRQMTNLFGTPKVPPKWVMGIHLCRRNGDIFNGGSIEKEVPFDSDCLDRGLLKSGFSLRYPSNEIKEKINLLKESKKKFILTNPLLVDMKNISPNGFKLIHDGRTNLPLIGDYNKLRNVSIPDLLDVTEKWNDAIKHLFTETTTPHALHISDNAPDLKLTNEKDCTIYFSHKELRSVFNDNLCHLYKFGSHSSSEKSHSDIRDDYPSIALEKSKSSLSNLFSDFASIGIQKHGWIISPGFDSQDIDEWDLLRHDLRMTLESGLSGIPLRSMNPCTTDERGQIRNEDACYRWFFLASFMPALNTLRVSPLSFKSRKYKGWLKRAFEDRYKLHPYYYTMIAAKQTLWEPLIRPLFYEFPWDPKTFSISQEHIMIGDSLLLTPVLSGSSHENEILNIYFPLGTWYDLGSGAITNGENKMVQVTCYKFKTPLFLRRGKILPMLENAGSSVEDSYEKHHYSLVVGLDCDFSPAKLDQPLRNCSAKGQMYLEEDKELLFETIRDETMGQIIVKLPTNKWSLCGESNSMINSILVYGLTDYMKELKLSNGQTIPVVTDDVNGQATYSKDYLRLQAKDLALDFCDSENDLIISWDFI